MPAKDLVQLSVYLHPDIKKALHKLAQRNQRSDAAEARVAIIRYVERYIKEDE